MINLEGLAVRHRHGDDWHDMEPVTREHSDPADHDFERRLVRGGPVYRCATCDCEVTLGDTPED